MPNSPELGSFLQSRRGRVRPEQVGLAVTARRRVQGLRREEVAQLAGISVEYYVRLEQGRAVHPSEEVLQALVRALGLDDDERRHLHDLARRRPVRMRPVRTERPRPELVQLLAAMQRVPALLINHRLDVLAWNQPATLLFFDFAAVPARGRNLARYAFLDPESTYRFVDWPEVARATAGSLRLAAGRHADDEGLAALLGELTLRSEDFRTMWARREVRQRTHGVKRFRHPLVGEVPLRFENLDLPGAGTQRLVMFSAEPGSAAQAALDLLVMLSAPETADAGQPRLIERPPRCSHAHASADTEFPLRT